jgi:hypothetical protein
MKRGSLPIYLPLIRHMIDVDSADVVAAALLPPGAGGAHG